MAFVQTKLLTVATLVGSLAASSVLGPMVAVSSGRHQLGYADTAEKSDPPQVALGIAMGAFRGIFVNFLWMRANALKEDGKYHEAIELSKAITTLQPRFPRVWAFHAWNQAYNISVATQTPEERWQWVQSGVNLLRTQGIPANPNDLLLHKELGWIFLHKIGGYTDDSNNWYKLWLAKEWHEVLGAPPEIPPSLDETEGAKQAFFEWMNRVAVAPETRDGLRSADPAAADLLERLREAGFAPDRALLSRYAAYAAFDESLLPMPPVLRDERFEALFNDASVKDAWEGVLAFTRKRVLLDDYGMQPQIMARFMQRFGPIDYRCPGAHALYWSAVGSERGDLRVRAENAKLFDFTNTDRVTMQAIQDLSRYGRLFYDHATVLLGDVTGRLGLPNVHFIDAYGSLIADVVRRSPIVEGKSRPFTVYGAGFDNFMKDQIRYLYRRGDLEAAERYRQTLIEFEHQNFNDMDRGADLSVPLDQLVSNELLDRLTSPSVIIQEIAASLEQAFFDGLLVDDPDVFTNARDYARAMHAQFISLHPGAVTASGGAGRMGGLVGGSDFAIAEGVMFLQTAASLTPDASRRLYGNAPAELRAFAYDMLQSRYRAPLDELAERNEGQSFDAIFPAPPEAVLTLVRLKLDTVRETISRESFEGIQQR